MSADAHLLPSNTEQPSIFDKIFSLYSNLLFKEEDQSQFNTTLDEEGLDEFYERVNYHLQQDDQNLLQEAWDLCDQIITTNDDLVKFLVITRVTLMFDEDDYELNREMLFIIQDICSSVSKQNSPIRNLFSLTNSLLCQEEPNLCSVELICILYKFNEDLKKIIYKQMKEQIRIFRNLQSQQQNNNQCNDIQEPNLQLTFEKKNHYIIEQEEINDLLKEKEEENLILNQLKLNNLEQQQQLILEEKQIQIQEDQSQSLIYLEQNNQQEYLTNLKTEQINQFNQIQIINDDLTSQLNELQQENNLEEKLQIQEDQDQFQFPLNQQDHPIDLKIEQFNQINQTKKIDDAQISKIEENQYDTLQQSSDAIQLTPHSENLEVENQFPFLPQKKKKKISPQAKAKIKIESRHQQDQTHNNCAILIDPGSNIPISLYQPKLILSHRNLREIKLNKEITIKLLLKYQSIKESKFLIEQDIFQSNLNKYHTNKLGILQRSQILRKVRLKKQQNKFIKKQQQQQEIISNKNKAMEDQLFNDIRNILKKQPQILRSETMPILPSFSKDLSNQIREIKTNTISIDTIKQIKRQISQLPIYQSNNQYHFQFNNWIPFFNQFESQEELTQGSNQLLGNLDYAIINELNKPAFKLSITTEKQQRQLIVFNPNKIDQLINYISTIKNISSIRAEWSNPNCKNDYYLSQYISMNKFKFKQWILERIPYSIPQIFNYDKDKFNDWINKLRNKEKNFNQEETNIMKQLIGSQILKIQNQSIENQTIQLNQYIQPQSQFKIILNNFYFEQIQLVGNTQKKTIKIKEFEKAKLEIIRSQKEPSQVIIIAEGTNLSEKEIIIKQLSIQFI